MAERFAGRMAIVTGGVSGIGAGIAARLASEGARSASGTRTPRRSRKRRRAHGSVDVTDAEAVQRAADATAAALGKIDILVASRRHHRAERARSGSIRSTPGTG